MNQKQKTSKRWRSKKDLLTSSVIWHRAIHFVQSHPRLYSLTTVAQHAFIHRNDRRFIQKRRAAPGPPVIMQHKFPGDLFQKRGSGKEQLQAYGIPDCRIRKTDALNWNMMMKTYQQLFFFSSSKCVSLSICSLTLPVTGKVWDLWKVISATFLGELSCHEKTNYRQTRDNLDSNRSRLISICSSVASLQSVKEARSRRPSFLSPPHMTDATLRYRKLLQRFMIERDLTGVLRGEREMSRRWSSSVFFFDLQ